MRLLQRYKQRRVIVRPATQVVLQVYLCSGIEIHLALLVALAKHDALAVGEVNIATVKQYQFSDAHASRGK